MLDRRVQSAFVIVLTALPIALAGSPASADEPAGYGYALAHELMSPYCPGRSLAACPSEQAAELRQWILLQEAAGATKEEVIAMVHERFGDEVLATPPSRGWGLVAKALPMSVLVLGAGIVFIVLRRMVGGRGASASSAPPPAAPARRATAPAGAGGDAELERIIDEELRLNDA